MKRLPVAAILALGCAWPVLAQPAIAQDAAQSAAPAAGQPAELCKELIAFVNPPAPAEAPKPAATPAPPPAPEQKSAVNAAGGAGDKPSAAAGAPQQNSGLSAPVPQDAGAKPVASARAAANGAAKVPATPATAEPTKPSADAVKAAEAAAASGDPAACRSAVRSMRQAGVTVPAPLLALAALNPKFFAPQ